MTYILTKQLLGGNYSKWIFILWEFDLEFINQMTPHHDGAVAMAEEALQKSEKPEIKTLANQIIKAQEAEIKMMNEWKTKWSK